MRYIKLVYQYGWLISYASYPLKILMHVPSWLHIGWDCFGIQDPPQTMKQSWGRMDWNKPFLEAQGSFSIKTKYIRLKQLKVSLQTFIKGSGHPNPNMKKVPLRDANRSIFSIARTASHGKTCCTTQPMNCSTGPFPVWSSATIWPMMANIAMRPLLISWQDSKHVGNLNRERIIHRMQSWLSETQLLTWDFRSEHKMSYA